MNPSWLDRSESSIRCIVGKPTTAFTQGDCNFTKVKKANDILSYIIHGKVSDTSCGCQFSSLFLSVGVATDDASVGVQST